MFYPKSRLLIGRDNQKTEGSIANRDVHYFTDQADQKLSESGNLLTYAYRCSVRSKKKIK